MTDAFAPSLNKGGRQRILVVDDDPAVLRLVESKFRMDGFEVFTAGDGREALSVIQRRGLPHLAIVDISMPGMDGFEVLDRIKGQVPETEVIVITGHGDMDLAVKALNHEATDFINKPINDDALDVALERARERISMRRQLKAYTENLEHLVREKSRQLIDAERLAARLRKENYNHVHVASFDRGDGLFHRVRVGRATSLKEADQYEQALIRQGFDVFIVAE